MVEIERKFLVNNEEYISLAFNKEYIKQGFLNTHPERTVRIRVINKKGYITVKGKSNSSGTSRFEWEREISYTDARALLDLCEDGVLEKDRYYVRSDRHIIEVDVFKGENKGLVVAEIELNNEAEVFSKPPWIGDEVTGEIRYYNSRLSKVPYKQWVTD